jgi:hypothetical protein
MFVLCCSQLDSSLYEGYIQRSQRRYNCVPWLCIAITAKLVLPGASSMHSSRYLYIEATGNMKRNFPVIYFRRTRVFLLYYAFAAKQQVLQTTSYVVYIMH